MKTHSQLIRLVLTTALLLILALGLSKPPATHPRQASAATLEPPEPGILTPVSTSPSIQFSPGALSDTPCEIALDYELLSQSQSCLFQRPGDSTSDMICETKTFHRLESNLVVPSGSVSINGSASGSYGPVISEGAVSLQATGFSSPDYALVTGGGHLDGKLIGKLFYAGEYRRDYSNFWISEYVGASLTATTRSVVSIVSPYSTYSQVLDPGISIGVTLYNNGAYWQEIAISYGYPSYNPPFSHQIHDNINFQITCQPIQGALSTAECIPGKYFVMDVPVVNRYDATIDWSETGVNSGQVRFDLGSQTTSYSGVGNEPVSQYYDMGSALRYSLLGADSPLTVRAFSGPGVEIDGSPQDRKLVGVIAPIWSNNFSAEQTGNCSIPGSHSQLKYLFEAKYPEEPFSGQVTPPDWVPYFGGKPTGIMATQATLNLEAYPTGQGSVVLTGKSGLAVAGEELKATISGQGDVSIHEGEGIHLDTASVQLEVAGAISAEMPLVDLLCKATTAGTCKLRDFEGYPVIGNAVRAMNQAAIAKASLEPTLRGSAEFKSVGEGLEWNHSEFDTSILGTIALDAAFFNDQLVAKGYGTAFGRAVYQVPPAPDYVKETELRVAAGVSLKAWQFVCKADASYGWIYPTNTTYKAATSDAGCDWEESDARAVFRAHEWEVLPGAGYRWTAGPLSTLADELIIASDVFPEGHPALISRGYTPVLLWTHDNPTLPTPQSTEIVFSQFNGSTWISPTAITTDTLQDFAPRAVPYGDNQVLAVWQRNKTQQDLSTTLDMTYTNDFEIAYATASQGGEGLVWTAPMWLTNNAALDAPLALTAGNDGQALLVWRQNSAGTLLGTNQTPDVLYYAIWDGNQWSAPGVALASLVGGLHLTAARHDDATMQIIFSQDMDGDFSTAADQELFQLVWNGTAWNAPVRLTTNTLPDRSPTLHYAPDGTPRLVWVKGDTLLLSSGDFTTAPRLLTTDSHIALLNYKSLLDEQGNLILVWQGVTPEGADLFYTTYEVSNDTINGVSQLTHDGAVEKFPSLAYRGNGELWLAYNKTTLLTETITVSPTWIISDVVVPGPTDLYFLQHTFAPDLTLDNLTVTPVAPLVGSIAHITATLTISGDRAVFSPTVTFNLFNPLTGTAEAYTITLPIALPAGSTRVVGIDWNVPAVPGDYILYAVADPLSNVAESNEGNNTISSLFTVLAADTVDLALTMIDSDPVTISNRLTYTLTIANFGSAEATGVILTNTLPSGVTFISAIPDQGSCSGVATVMCDLGSLAKESRITVVIVVTAPTTPGTLLNTASVASNQIDFNTGNNLAVQGTTVIMIAPAESKIYLPLVLRLK